MRIVAVAALAALLVSPVHADAMKNCMGAWKAACGKIPAPAIGASPRCCERNPILTNSPTSGHRQGGRRVMSPLNPAGATAGSGA
jgi:hypothetical protein